MNYLLKKINLFAVAGLIVGGMAVFTAAKSSASVRVSGTWFEYLGNINGGAETNPQNFELIGSEPTSCNGEAALCAIQGDQDGTSEHPTQATVDQPEAVRKYQ